MEEHQEAYGVIRPRKNPFDDDGPGIGHDPTMLFEKTHQMVLPETVLKDLQSQVEGLGKAGEDAIEISLLKDLVEMPDSSLVDKARVDVNQSGIMTGGRVCVFSLFLLFSFSLFLFFYFSLRKEKVQVAT